MAAAPNAGEVQRPGKAPAFQWYPGDHKRDTALQSCSFVAKALWREMLDLMHDGTPYGHLTANGVPIDAATLARMVGMAPKQARTLMHELELRGVFSRTEAGVIFSRRMVRDEHLRAVRREAGSKGGEKTQGKIRDGRERSGVDLIEQTREQTAEQTREQNTPPAVAVLQSAFASASALPPPTTAVGGTATAAGGGGGPCTSWSEFAQRTDVHAGRTYAELAAGFLATLADDSTRSECARVSADAILSDTSLTTLARALDAWISAPPAVRTKETWRQHLRGVRYRGIQDTIVAEKRRLAPA